MSEQAVDLRSTWAVVRRRGGILAAAAVLGAVAGGVLLYVSPPPFTSSSVVLLPSAAQSGSGKTGGYDAETQVLIATSSEILSRAAQMVEPEPAQDEVLDRVTVAVPAPSILRITAEGPTVTQAEDLVSAVADSLVAYLKESTGTLSEARRVELQDRLDTLTASLTAMDGEISKAKARIAAQGGTTAAGLADAAALSDLTAVHASTVLDIDALKKQMAGEDVAGGEPGGGANVLQAASPGRQSGYVTEALIHVLGGAAIFVLFTALYFIVTNQRDPKLRSRDEIATSVGIPVVASLRARPPRSAGAWAELLRSYEPDSADGWGLRQLIHALVPDAGKEWPSDDPFVLVVLSVSGDSGGLAIGPQIASFAASNGIPTQLFAAQQHESATPLWAACSGPLRRDDRPALSVTTVPDSLARVDISVRLVVLDRDTPDPDATVVAGGTALLAVSSASVTRRNLADAVVAADQVGLTVQGIIVANPDPLDRTTGRLAPLERPGSPAPGPTPITARSGGKAPDPAGGQRRQNRGGRR